MVESVEHMLGNNNNINNNSVNDQFIEQFCKQSLINTHKLYNHAHPSTVQYASLLGDDSESRRIKVYSKIVDEYSQVKDMPASQSTSLESSTTSTSTSTHKQQSTPMNIDHTSKDIDSIISSLPNTQDDKRRKLADGNMSIVLSTNSNNQSNQLATTTGGHSLTFTKPAWHPPWKLMRVISGHTGWVRAVSVDVNNEFFVTGATDNTIKVWDLASGELKLTLVYHVGPVRALQVSQRHPYLFSVGEDNKVICWDLEANRPIRHYYGHKNGVYSLALHPTLDLLFSGGRDSTVKVWDMRTKSEIFSLTGHKDTVCSLLSQSPDPQLISGSMDSTIRLWDLATGGTAVTLTNHKKSVRAMVMHEKEFSFASGSADNLKQWKLPEGQFIKNLSGHNAIVNCMALNQDNVLVSGGDNGSMQFWDWKTGYCFQKAQTTVQPGSLDSEAGIFAMSFDRTGTRLITCEADKTIKIYKEDEEANESTHPITDWRPTKNIKRF
ncbi:hypothetical protein SAMD00019534_002650, partial [Acytostelium subglobosum LB1]|uniref:hypothetical protein n=1 Tax=Acytostelium subglobosum LB1 TaxID=1410327 RepID=UPI0006451A4B